MFRKNKRLPEAELEIMICLWDAGTSVQRSYFSEKFDWADSTILTLLSRLESRGFVSVAKKGNKNVYTAALTKDEYMKVENKNFLNKLHNGSIRHFVASLADTDNLSGEDIDELETLLKELRKK